MTQVNIFQAKTELSKLIVSLENGEQDQIVIARGGKPVAVLKCYEPPKKKRKLGIMNGKYRLPDDLDACNDEVFSLMGGAGEE